MSSNGAWAQRVAAVVKPDGKRPWVPLVASKIADTAAEVQEPVIVDVGCGTSSWILARANVKAGWKVGVDTDVDLALNRDVDRLILSSAERLPFESDSVDLILSGFVLEHLEHPQNAVREFGRVLKPGGTAIFWASNKHNYAIALSAMTPTWFHNWVRRIALRDVHKENCPTYYRANTPKALKKMLAESGLEHRETFFGATAYQYWGFSKALLALAALGSRIVSDCGLSCLKSTIIVVAQKPKTELNLAARPRAA